MEFDQLSFSTSSVLPATAQPAGKAVLPTETAAPALCPDAFCRKTAPPDVPGLLSSRNRPVQDEPQISGQSLSVRHSGFIHQSSIF